MATRALIRSDIASLAARLAELPLLQRYGRTSDKMARDLERALERGDGLRVHLDDAGAADGLVWFLPSGTFAAGGYLKLLAVAPGAHARGAGAELLADFEAAVREASRHAFLLVSDFNDGAQRFYERHGYARVGGVPGMVLSDVVELVYWKRLR